MPNECAVSKKDSCFVRNDTYFQPSAFAPWRENSLFCFCAFMRSLRLVSPDPSGCAATLRSRCRRAQSAVQPAGSPRHSRAGPLRRKRNPNGHRPALSPPVARMRPKSAATTGFDREAVAVVDFGGLDFACRKGLHRAAVMADEDLIRQRVIAAVQTPGRADGPLDMGVDGRRAAHAHFVGYAQGRRETCPRRRSLGAARDARR